METIDVRATNEPVEVSLVVWSDLARGQGEYMKRLMNGETFAIMHASKPVAIVRPLRDSERLVLTLETEKL